MSVHEQEEELKALKDRVEADKRRMADLRDQNEELAAKLQAATQPSQQLPRQQPSPQQPSPQQLPQQQPLQQRPLSQKTPTQTPTPSPAKSMVSTKVTSNIEYGYMPKHKTGAMFSGQSGTITYYDWVDDVQNSVNFSRYSPREQAAYLYDHLEGEAKQEVKHGPREMRSNPVLLLKIL